MNLLILKGFNNYFNRRIVKYSALADYVTNSRAHYLFGDVNFNPNDGIATSQIIGSENQQQTGGPDPVPLNWEVDGSPDYLIAYTSETIDEQEVISIHSRWFVLESVRTRAGQYQLALKRDVIADNLEKILTSPCFIEKGYVNSNNKLIFNEEGVSFNEIKQEEHPLYDETGVPWLVLYIAQNFPNDQTAGIDANGNLPIEGRMVLDDTEAIDISDLPWGNLESTISDTRYKRYVKGASELSVNPIFALECDTFGAPKIYTQSFKVWLKYGYTNSWVINKNTSRITSLGYSETWNVGFATWLKLRVLSRGDINLTPAKNRIHWDNDGGIVATYSFPINYWSADEEAAGDLNYGPGTYTAKDTYTRRGAEILLNENLNSPIPNSMLNYLNSKRTALQSITSSYISDNIKYFNGGSQLFVPASKILSYNGKIVKDIYNNVYKISVSRKNNTTTYLDKFELSNDDIVTSSNNYLGATIPHSRLSSFTLNSNNTMVETTLDSAWFEITYEKINSNLLRFTLPKPVSRSQLNDAAYDMIVLPYGEIPFVVPADDNQSDLPVMYTSKEASLGIARSIAAKASSGCYDLQLLPYCPYRQIVEQYKQDGYINCGVTSASAGWTVPYSSWSGVYSISNPGETPSRVNCQTIGLWCPYSSGSFDIEYNIEMPEDDPIEYKLFNASKKFRLVSPNYSGIFEFSPLKNNGVTTFNIDYTYKPYNPYIHIAPFFNASGLYGTDTNDARGLILQGDFSIGYYSDPWANYQIQNANYANIFNRQVENIDFNQRQEREKFRVDRTTEGITEVLGLGGGLSGAKSFSGLGPWGMLGGAIGGTLGGMTAHGLGTYYDKKWMEEAQQEERSYAIDMYNLNLGNVKATPYSLAKTDALNTNFKYVPFIEIWDCSDIEKEMFRKKLEYDGMTINGIGTIADFLPKEEVNYTWQKIKGRMIMLDNIVDDFQVANAIYTEINKGFYYCPYIESGD